MGVTSLDGPCEGVCPVGVVSLGSCEEMWLVRVTSLDSPCEREGACPVRVVSLGS